MQTPTIIISIILVVMVLLVPRKWLLLPFIMAACIVPAYQRVIIFGLDFTPLRILILFGVIKLLMTGNKKPIRLNLLDKLIITWMISGTIIYIIQWKTFSSVIYKSGVMFDCFGLYYIFRHNLRSWDDIFFTIKIFAFFAIVSAPLLLYERFNESSVFESLGRTAAGFHRGRFRCSGPFPHPIMMGLFWVNLLPMFIACAKIVKNKTFFYTAIAAAMICVYLSGSSTPVMAMGAIFVFWFIYRFRMYGKTIAISLACLLIGLHLVMKAPVWHLIARVNLFSGSTGWHRYILIDRTISNFSEWALFGTKGVEHWGIWAGDITNQFVAEGVSGGFITMMIFIFLLFYAISISGKCSLIPQPAQQKWLCWAMCVTMLGHCVSFFGVSYFGQIIMLLYLHFACVSFISDHYRMATSPNTVPIRSHSRQSYKAKSLSYPIN